MVQRLARAHGSYAKIPSWAGGQGMGKNLFAINKDRAGVFVDPERDVVGVRRL